MKRCLSLALFILVGISGLQGMNGEWIPLAASLKECARSGAMTISQANIDLKTEAQSRNSLTVYLPANQQIVLFSGVSPFKQFSTVINEKYFSFLDVLIGKKDANILFKVANESKEIISDFQKAFKTLKANVAKSSKEEQSFLTLMGILGINEGSSLAELEKHLIIIKTSIQEGVSMQSWGELFARLETYVLEEKSLTGGEKLLVPYAEALKRYLIFLQSLPCLKDESTILLQAIEQADFLKRVAPHIANERLIDTISENSNSIAVFTHTETLLAYLMFSDDVKSEIFAYKEPLVQLFKMERNIYVQFFSKDVGFIK